MLPGVAAWRNIAKFNKNIRHEMPHCTVKSCGWRVSARVQPAPVGPVWDSLTHTIQHEAPIQPFVAVPPAILTYHSKARVLSACMHRVRAYGWHLLSTDHAAVRLSCDCRQEQCLGLRHQVCAWQLNSWATSRDATFHHPNYGL